MATALSRTQSVLDFLEEDECFTIGGFAERDDTDFMFVLHSLHFLRILAGGLGAGDWGFTKNGSPITLAVVLIAATEGRAKDGRDMLPARVVAVGRVVVRRFARSLPLAIVGSLARHAVRRRVVHYSTDYVFDGQKSGAYVESDATQPLGIYGLSKRRGEEAILQSQCSALIFRTSWVFSAFGSNFIKTILRLAKEKNSLNIVADQFGAPTSAELIADVTSLAIAGYRSGTIAPGIYHLTAKGETNWHGFACHIVNRAIANGFLLQLDSSTISPITTEEYPVPARRPKNSRLDTELLSSRLGLQLPDWTIHVNRTIDQMPYIPRR